jgi:hypothetical protein
LAQALANKVQQIFTDYKCSFGSRRLADGLQKQGITIGRCQHRLIPTPPFSQVCLDTCGPGCSIALALKKFAF